MKKITITLTREQAEDITNLLSVAVQKAKKAVDVDIWRTSFSLDGVDIRHAKEVADMLDRKVFG